MQQYTDDVNMEIPEIMLAKKKEGAVKEVFQLLATKYLKENVKNISPDEVRFLVNTYYQVQGDRIRANNQLRQLVKAGEKENFLLSFLAERHGEIEAMIKKALQFYVVNHPVGEWLIGIHGIGPVIAAGLVAHIDINKAPTAGHIWSYAGLDPTKTWEKGQKRPWNADLKKICWHAGQSFVKHSSSPKCVYGHLYLQRKAEEVAKNDAGGNAEQAAKDVSKYAVTTDAYKHVIAGKLPPAQLQARAERYTVKIFLSHLQQLWWEWETGTPAPKPFAIAILGHGHMIQPQGSIRKLKIPD